MIQKDLPNLTWIYMVQKDLRKKKDKKNLFNHFWEVSNLYGHNSNNFQEFNDKRDYNNYSILVPNKSINNSQIFQFLNLRFGIKFFIEQGYIIKFYWSKGSILVI